ncbi:MAG: tRNA pseudouridine(55) synthase TruB [Synechococcaceae cyanobacterium SM2_3_2]|nr:tRNA pseudouridine(55) synthase TruB [Synechococcaceae cyanobacterium SM2_3_2]
MPQAPSPTGFLNLHKPAGFTSHDCVALVRKAYGTRKVGHGGTLDPAATGVLPIALGQATRFLSFLSGQKLYQATFRLGVTSDTDDATGVITAFVSDQDPCLLTLELTTIEAALQTMVGSINQVPPLYSAVKRDGQKLYQRARQGILATDLMIPARPVTIQQIRILDWRPGHYPELDLDILCGSGTYIRAIARDLGQKLGCGGLMSALVRSQSGPFHLEASVPLDQIRQMSRPESVLMPIEQGFADLAVVRLDPELAWRWGCGQRIPVEALSLDAHDLGSYNGDPEDSSGLGSPNKNRPVQVRRAEIGDQPDLADQVLADQFLGLGQIEVDQLTALRVLPQISTRP